MSADKFLSIGIGVLVVVGLIFLSMIHLFMIPKNVLRRELQGGGDDNKMSDKGTPDSDQGRKPEPEIKEHPHPGPDVDRAPENKKDPEPDKERPHDR